MQYLHTRDTFSRKYKLKSNYTIHRCLTHDTNAYWVEEVAAHRSFEKNGLFQVIIHEKIPKFFVGLHNGENFVSYALLFQNSRFVSVPEQPNHNDIGFLGLWTEPYHRHMGLSRRCIKGIGDWIKKQKSDRPLIMSCESHVYEMISGGVPCNVRFR